MGYIERSLGPGEKLLAEAHFPLLFRSFGYLVLLAFLIAAGYIITEFRWYWIGGLTALIGLALFLWIMLYFWTTEIGLTSNRLILKYGWLTRQTAELELGAVEVISLQQGILGRTLGFGTMTAYGTGEQALHLPPIADPLAFRRAIEAALVVVRQAGGA